MAVRKTITVSITPEQADFLRDRLKSGRFASVSEIVRAALRLLEREETNGARDDTFTPIRRPGADFA